MLISRAHQKVVLNLRDPDRVCTVIPTAKKFLYKGHTLVAVPHRLDETRVLHNLGIPAPAPIRYQYDWPRAPHIQPFHAQVATSEHMVLNPYDFVLNDMGTGKTLATLWAFDYLRSLGLARRMLIISPLSTLERTWADEVFANFPHLTCGVVYGTKDRRAKILAHDFDIYVINHDGIKVMQQELAARPDIDTVVVDEGAAFRNASTARWKSLRAVAKDRTRLWWLTGTPTPTAPTDAWAQCRLVAPARVPPYFGRFKDQVMQQLGPFKWVARASANQIVADCMQPAIRFRRDECVDLPPTLYQTREVALTDEQQKAYKAMLGQLKMEYAGGQVTASNEAVKLAKLLQIGCGVVYDEHGQEVLLPNTPRVEEVNEIIEQAGGKVIVFVPFKAALRRLAEELRLKGHTVAEISGDVGKTARDDIFHRFQKTVDPHVLVAQPMAMSHGLTLTAANTVVWFGPITSNEVYQQANARVTRPGQKLTTLVVDIEATAAERRMYQRLRDRQTSQGVLLDLLKEC
jgi:SNF2 family DNA or RNA helicase